MFKPSSICVAMYSRGDGETFHQCIVIPTQSTGQRSKKLHATNLSGGWIYEVIEDDLDKALALVTVIELGMLTPERTFKQLDELLRDIPLNLSSEDLDTGEFERFACRVWTRQAIRYMARNGFIVCGDAKAAHDEIVQHALANDAAVSTGTGKFTYCVSSYRT